MGRLRAPGILGTAFLVDSVTVATSAHVLPGCAVRGLRFVFGFAREEGRLRANDRFAEDDVYRGWCMRGFKMSPTGSDWALIVLDRAVRGRTPLEVHPDRVNDEEPLYMLGHPLGLPLAYTGKASVLENSIDRPYFKTDLASHRYNSGSPVIRARDNVVVGIHSDRVRNPVSGAGPETVDTAALPSVEVRSTEFVWLLVDGSVPPRSQD
jgi:hypothetical protein